MNAVTRIPVSRDTDMNGWVWTSMVASDPIGNASRITIVSQELDFPTWSIERNDARMYESEWDARLTK